MEHHHTEIIESSFLVHTCYIIRCHIGLDFVTLILSLSLSFGGILLIDSNTTLYHYPVFLIFFG